MEEIRDLMDDMEIEFEMLQKQIMVLEGQSSKATDSPKLSNEESKQAPIEEDDDEELDLENTSSVFVKPKF